MELSQIQLILLKLLNIPGLGPVRIKYILENIPSIETIFQLSLSTIQSQIKLSRPLIDAIRHFQYESNVQQQRSLMDRYQIRCTALTDSDYPQLLKTCYDPPPLLFYRGRPECLNLPAIAIVGTRHPDSYGIKAVEKITTELVESANVMIVSGLAQGIDTLAHRACLHHQGCTAAVVGTGLDVVYPASNKNLMQEIIRKGIVISEYLPGSPPLAANFPRRNRIISGLALGTLIVQAGTKSGALITADFALNQNREIFAVPASIFRPASQGTNNLIRDSAAHLVTSGSEILSFLPAYFSQSPEIPMPNPIPLTPGESFIIHLLYQGITNLEDLSSHLNSDDALNLDDLLLQMETKGLIRRLPDLQIQLLGTPNQSNPESVL